MAPGISVDVLEAGTAPVQQRPAVPGRTSSWPCLLSGLPWLRYGRCVSLGGAQAKGEIVQKQQRASWRLGRWALLVAVIAGVMFLAGLIAAGAFGVGRSLFRPEIGASGVVTFDRAKTDDGFVSTGVMNDDVVNLVAKDGEIVHSWPLRNGLVGMAAMRPDGSLIYMSNPPDVASQLPAAFGADGSVEQLGWDGQVQWTVTDPLFSHDFTELPDGTLAVLRLSKLPPDLAARIPGGIPNSELDGQVWGNQIVEVDPATHQERVVFDIADAWLPEDHPIPDFMQRAEWTHGNSIFYTPSDPLTHQEAYVVSFRTVSTILLVSRATGEIIWSYGGPWVLDQQHDATLLPNGHVLLFDDGQYLRGAPSASKVLEIDPQTDTIAWSYSGYGIVGANFYSAITGGAQRLPNGNTMATLGTKGQLMEVTANGEVVWDYHVGSDISDPKYPTQPWNMLFKSRSYPRSEVQPLLDQ